MTAEGMRKSELFWPHHSISTAAKQPGKRWSAPLKLSEVTGQRETERQEHRGRGRGGGARHWPGDIPVRSRWEEGEGEGERERPRKVSRRRVKRLQGGRGDKEERGGREERQRGGRGGHTLGRKKHGGFGAGRVMGVARSRPAPHPTPVGVGPWWKPFGSQGAMVKGMAGSMRCAWAQGRMGEVTGTAGRGSQGWPWPPSLPPKPRSILKFLGPQC